MQQCDIQNNGIAILDGFYSQEYCDKLINIFELSLSNGLTWDRTECIELDKKDKSVMLNQESNMYIGTDNTSLISEFNFKFFEECYKKYCEYFSVLNTVGRHGIYSYKLQKTVPGGGYHVWHCEQDSSDRARRMGVYILYLNDVDEGGETEFLYLNQRVKPLVGRLVIFPAGYIHTHRGNPPLRGSKYILTGWIEYF